MSKGEKLTGWYVGDNHVYFSAAYFPDGDPFRRPNGKPIPAGLDSFEDLQEINARLQQAAAEKQRALEATVVEAADVQLELPTVVVEPAGAAA